MGEAWISSHSKSARGGCRRRTDPQRRATGARGLAYTMCTQQLAHAPQTNGGGSVAASICLTSEMKARG